MSMKVQKQCEACENDIFFWEEYKDATRFCDTCCEEFDTMLDAPRLTDEELDDWSINR